MCVCIKCVDLHVRTISVEISYGTYRTLHVHLLFRWLYYTMRAWVLAIIYKRSGDNDQRNDEKETILIKHTRTKIYSNAIVLLASIISVDQRRNWKNYTKCWPMKRKFLPNQYWIFGWNIIEYFTCVRRHRTQHAFASLAGRCALLVQK